MASGIDDNQHTPMAAAAHTARYDLQADMAAGAIRNGDQAAGVATGRRRGLFLHTESKKKLFFPFSKPIEKPKSKILLN